MKQGWEIKKLGEVCDILDSQRKPVTKKDRKEGIYPYYGATGIQDYVDAYIFDGRYLLVGEDGAKWGAMDKTAFVVEGKCWVNNHAHILKVHDNLIDTFIEYYLVFKDLDEYITGAIVRKLTQQALREIPIPVPPIAEQEKIVAELDCLSGIIEKKKQQLKELDNLAQSIFYEMFGDPDNSRFPKLPLQNLSEYKLSYGSGASAVEFDKDVRYVRITDIQEDGKLDSNAMSPSVYEEKYLLHDGDILFARSGATVGKTYHYRNTDGKAIYAGYLIRFIPNQKLVLPEYVFYYTRSDYYHAFIRKSAQAVAQPNINAKQYGDLIVCVPPLSLQQDFASKIESIEKQKELIAQSIKETETLFHSRMDYYFG